MFGKLKPEEIEVFLNSHLVGRIGCHSGGRTYVVPVSYAYDGDNIYVHSLEGLKVEMMRENPSVCFQVDDTRKLSDWQSVICWGEFEEITEMAAKKEALDLLNSRVAPQLTSETMHVNPEWPFTSNSVDTIKGLFFKIKVREKTGRFETPSGDTFYAT